MGHNFTRRDALLLGVGGVVSLFGMRYLSPSTVYGAVSSISLSRCESDRNTTMIYQSYLDKAHPMNAWCATPGAHSGALQGSNSRDYRVSIPAVELTQSLLNARHYSWGWNGTATYYDSNSETYSSGFTLAEARAILWCSPGNPGYDANMWSVINDTPGMSQWTTVRKQDEYMHYISTMILAGYNNRYVGQSAMYTPYPIGDSDDLKLVMVRKAFGWTTLNQKTKPSANSLVGKMMAKADAVPDSFKVYILNEDGSWRNGSQAWVTTAYLQPGTLIVKKVYSGSDNPAFSFAVSFTGAGAPSKKTFTLHKGEEYRIPGIPVGVNYKVTETTPGYVSSWVNQTGQISASTPTVTCTCTNTVGSLTVKKIFDADANTSFNFKVTFTYSGTTRTETFSLKSGETKTFKDLKIGTKYVVEETTSGFAPEWTGRTGTISATNLTANCVCENTVGYLQITKDVTD